MRSRVVQVDTQKITAARRGREVLKLNLFDDAVVEVQIKRVRPTRTGYFISGTPKGMEWGEVRLVVNGPVMVGTVITPESRFTIRSGGSGRHVIRQIDPSAEPFECEAEHGPLLPPERPQQAISSIGPTLAGGFSPTPAQARDMPTEDGSEIRMLVVYTPAARDGEGGTAGMEALIDLAIQSINEVFEEGGINPRIILAHSAMVDPIEHEGPGTQTYLQTHDDGYLDDVHGLRNQYAADLVYLFIRRDSGGTGSGGIPKAEDLREERSGFAYGSTTRNLEYIFIHETGHMLGIRHERYRKGPRAGGQLYPYNYGYVNQRAFEPGAPESSRWTTVMAKFGQCAAAGFSCAPIIRFSNPDQTYLGDPMGVSADSKVTGAAGPADARLAINNIAPWVGSFRSEACTDFAATLETPAMPVGGGEALIRVDTAPGCLWEVSTQSEILTVTSDELNAGPQVVTVEVPQNTSGVERSAILTVAGKEITVRQLATTDGVCGRTSTVLEAIAVAAGFASGAQCGDVTDDDLSRIQSLDLSGKSIDSLKQGDFSGLSGLQTLYLSSNDLTELPENLFSDLSSLEHLRLNSNDLTQLPEGLFEGLLEFQHLNLDDNQLEGFQTGQFAGLSKLKTLWFSRNQLADLPSQLFAGLHNLRSLHLSENRLAQLPDTLFAGLSSLESLSLRSNQVSMLSASLFSDLSSLRSLELSINQLTRVPASIFDGLSNLSSLSLAGNQLTELPAGMFDGLAQLGSLSLNNNRLTELRSGTLAEMPRLVSLTLNRNDLSSLPADTFSGLSELNTLFLDHNQLDSLPGGIFSDLTKLRTLLLSYNRLNLLPEGVFSTLEKLNALHLQYNKLTTLRQGVFSSLGELDKLYLNDNNLSSLPDGMFSGVPRLGTVNLTYNTVEPLPVSLSLVKEGDSQFKAITPQGAPFTLVVLVSISSSGTIDGGQDTITIPAGAVASKPVRFERAEGMEEAVRVEFGDFPYLPPQHVGYVLLKGESLPLQVLPSISDSDATLNSLSVSGAMLSPAFAAELTSYSAVVGNSVPSVSVATTTSNADATVSYFDESDIALTDLDANADGHQVGLSQGENTIKVKVTSADGLTTKTYSVVVTRDKSINVCGRTPQVRDAIVYKVPGVDHCTDVTETQLSEITRLDLNRKKITSLKPGDFAGLNQLSTLRLQYNELRTIPAGVFFELSQLGYLSLRSNPLGNLSANAFSGLTTLHTLDVDNIGWTTMPKDVFSALPNLGKLLLGNNRLTSLPAGILDGLPKLWDLNLINNRLSNLAPGLLSGVPALTELSLYGNRISSLSQSDFANLPNLWKLRLDENSLRSLPYGVFSDLDSLTQLDLRENLFARLPAGVFSGLADLESLHMEGNLGEPLPLPVSLEKAGENQYKAVVSSGAPFDLELSVSISDSEAIDSDLIAVTIPAGAVASTELPLTRLPETGEIITVDISTLPALRDNHQGYAFAKDETLPLLFLSGQTELPPGQVTGLEATVGAEELAVSWTAVTDASGYKVQWKSGEQEYDEARQVVLAGGDTTSYTITGLTAGTEYTVRAIATKENADDGAPSSEVTGTPSERPASQVAGVEVVAGVEQLEVSWDAVSDANGYKVQWTSDEQDYGEERQAVLTGGETVNYTITGLTAGTEYMVRVIATREDSDNGSPSSEVAGLPKASPPSQVTGVEVAAGVEQLALIWTANADAGGYKVQWKSGEEDYDDSRQATITDGDEVDYTITGLTAGTEHTVRIIATKVNAEDSLPSDEVTGTPRAMPAGQVTGVQVSSGVEQLDVSWTAVSDTSGYRVQWKSGDEAYDAAREVEVAGGETLGHTITGLTAGTEYTARVIAVMDNADDGPPSSEVSGAPKALPPAQVTDVELSVGVEQLDVSWSVVSDASGYKVQWKSGEEDYDEARQTVVTGGNTVNYTIAGLTVGTSYTIRVIATKAHADGGAPSTEVTGIPKAGPPVQVEGVEVTPGVEQLDVSWTAVSDAGGYKVQWKSGSEDYAELRQAVLIDGDTVSHTIESLTAGTEYTVRVIATKEFADDGLPSEQVTAIPKATPPAQVTGVEVEPGAEQLEVLWTPVTDAGGYKVQWKSGTEAYGDARQAAIGSGDTTTHTITGLTADTEYTIRVIATKDNADDGTPSDEVTATPISADPDVNGDGVLDGNDALILYHSYASAAQLGDGETGGTAASRQSLLAGYSGQTSPSDDDLKAMIRKANAWKEAGVNAGGDINEDGVIDESDAFVMYYAYATENLVGDGETGGTARFRQLLLAAFANKDNPTDEDLKAMLRRANELREDFG